MSKHLFFLAAAGAIALTACTSEEVVDDVVSSRNVISFENVVNKPTRDDSDVATSGDLTSKNLAKFNVFGYYTMPENPTVPNKIFDNVTVTRQPNGTWTYDNTPRYWVANGRYYFFAYSCGNVSKLDGAYGSFSLNMDDNLTASDRGALKINGYICDNTHQHDLIYAANTGAVDGDPYAGILGKDKGNQAVPLQFKHLLSKVSARFTTEFPNEYRVEISNVSIQNIRNTGDYNDGWQNVTRLDGEFPFVTLLNTDDPTVNPISVENKLVDGIQMFVDTNNAYVLPYKYDGSDASEESANTWVSLNFEIDVYFNNELVMHKILTGKFNPQWNEGCSYVYNVKISGDTTGMEVITFTTGTDADGNVISAWNKDESPVITIDK